MKAVKTMPWCQRSEVSEVSEVSDYRNCPHSNTQHPMTVDSVRKVANRKDNANAMARNCSKHKQTILKLMRNLCSGVLWLSSVIIAIIL